LLAVFGAAAAVAVAEYLLLMQQIGWPASLLADVSATADVPSSRPRFCF